MGYMEERKSMRDVEMRYSFTVPTTQPVSQSVVLTTWKSLSTKLKRKKETIQYSHPPTRPQQA